MSFNLKTTLYCLSVYNMLMVLHTIRKKYLYYLKLFNFLFAIWWMQKKYHEMKQFKTVEIASEIIEENLRSSCWEFSEMISSVNDIILQGQYITLSWTAENKI